MDLPALIQSFDRTLEEAGESTLRTKAPPLVQYLKDGLIAYCGKFEGLQIIPAASGLVINQNPVPDTQGSELCSLLRAHRVAGIYIPAWIHKSHLWRMLVIMAMEPQRIMQAGGLELCLDRGDVKAVRVHLLPADQTEDTLPFAPLPELEEIDKRLAEPRSGDTIESEPIKRSGSPSERAATYTRLTREIVRAFAADGPDATARALILVWRRAAAQMAGVPDAGLDSPAVVAMLHRIDPLTRFAVLASLGYTTEGKKVAGQIPDHELAESLSSAIVWEYRGGHTACLAVLRTARMGALERQPVIAATRLLLQHLDRMDDVTWSAVEESSAVD